jgi:Zn finger protein HypA/HybF involved in hydrogenase expression
MAIDMRAEEAIEQIKALKGLIEWEHSLTFQLALDEAIDALERQVPIRPNVSTNAMLKHRAIRCPNCDSEIPTGRPLFYCPLCGQAIDWSET